MKACGFHRLLVGSKGVLSGSSSRLTTLTIYHLQYNSGLSPTAQEGEYNDLARSPDQLDSG